MPHETLTLYSSPYCGYCHRVLMAIQQLDVTVGEKNIFQDDNARNELITHGGKSTVPCLRIDKEDGSYWMYESADIIQYLIQNYS